MVKKNKLSDEILLSLYFLSAETSYNPETGVKRADEGVSVRDTHYDGLLTRMMEQNIASRLWLNGPVEFMKGFALVADAEVTPELAANVLEYALVHRVRMSDAALTEARDAVRDDARKAPLNQYAWRMQLGEVLRRFREHEPMLRDISTRLYRTETEEAV